MTVRLADHLAEWLQATAEKTGLPASRPLPDRDSPRRNGQAAKHSCVNQFQIGICRPPVKNRSRRQSP